MNNKVYVVVSNTIAYGQTYNGIHGVHKTIESAHKSAISAITSIAQRYNSSITKDDITIDYEDCIYSNIHVDIVVSCIEQYIS